MGAVPVPVPPEETGSVPETSEVSEMSDVDTTPAVAFKIPESAPTVSVGV